MQRANLVVRHRISSQRDEFILRFFLAILAALGFLLLAADAAGAAVRPVTIQVAGEMTTKNVRTEESSLANVITDALRAVDKADIAFMPASGFQEVSIPKGTATSEDILKSLMYRDDTVVIVRLTGAQVRKALEQAMSLSPQKNSAFLQVSGLTVNADVTLDKEKRIVSVKVGKNPLALDKTYNVAMPAPLANGALAYFKVWSKKDVDHETDKTLEQAVTDSLNVNRNVGGKSEERIVIKK